MYTYNFMQIVYTNYVIWVYNRVIKKYKGVITMSCVNLFPHQAAALERTAVYNRVAFYHDM